MKRLVYVVLVGLLLLPVSAMAENNFYTNDNGVTLNKEEYNFLSLMFWDGCQDLMTEDDYKNFIASNIINGETDYKTLNTIVPFGTSLSRIDRSLKIAKSCSNDCYIVITAIWNQTPTIKSYDVIGARFEDTSLTINSVRTDSTNPNASITNDKIFSNGLGTSVNASGFKTGTTVVQRFNVKKGGHVYATYQHAMGPISLNNSMQYTISTDGYGRVFKFSGTAVNLYDKFGYVDIAL